MNKRNISLPALVAVLALAFAAPQAWAGETPAVGAQAPGFKLQDQNGDWHDLGDYRGGFNFENMNRALKLLLEGAGLIVMIPEKVDHSLGTVELTVGAYGKMLEDAAGIKATYIGKPGVYMFDTAIANMQIDRGKVLMVGDRVSTDILGARRAAIKSVLVKTGEFKESDLTGDLQPDFLVNSLNEINVLF